MTYPKNVFAIDDDEVVLMSLQAVLSCHGYEVHGFTSAEVFLNTIPLNQPGCVVADFQMSTMNGLELQRRLVVAESTLAFVVVSGAASVSAAVQFMENGAVTLLEKPYRNDALVAAVEKALAISWEQFQRRETTQSVVTHLARLSDGEREVLQLMILDLPNKTIASRLFLSMRTVDRRRRSVLDKMGVSSVPELVRILSLYGDPVSLTRSRQEIGPEVSRLGS